MRPLRTPQNNPQNLTITSSTQQSAAFGANSKYVRLLCTTTCNIAFGANPTATAASLTLVANVPEFFGVTPGQKLAVIGTAGILSIVEGNAL